MSTAYTSSFLRESGPSLPQLVTAPTNKTPHKNTLAEADKVHLEHAVEKSTESSQDQDLPQRQVPVPVPVPVDALEALGNSTRDREECYSAGLDGATSLVSYKEEGTGTDIGMGSEGSEGSGRVQVLVRVRPFLGREGGKKGGKCASGVAVVEEEKSVRLVSEKSKYSVTCRYDGVFDCGKSQATVFQEAFVSTIQAALSGINATM